MGARALVQIVEGDLLETLRRCGGYYDCPKDATGKRLGPLVGYAGKYKAEDGVERQYVGDTYFSFSKAEEYPHVLDYCAHFLGEVIRKELGSVDFVLSAPMGGLALGSAVARDIDSRYIFAEKKVTALATNELRQQETLELIRHQLEPGARVVLVEDVTNNFSTTEQMMNLVEGAQATVLGIVCALNRSLLKTYDYRGQAVPVFPLAQLMSKQYRQDDPEVAEDMARGNIVLKPKHHWERLQKAMGV